VYESLLGDYHGVANPSSSITHVVQEHKPVPRGDVIEAHQVWWEAASEPYNVPSSFKLGMRKKTRNSLLSDPWQHFVDELDNEAQLRAYVMESQEELIEEAQYFSKMRRRRKTRDLVNHLTGEIIKVSNVLNG